MKSRWIPHCVLEHKDRVRRTDSETDAKQNDDAFSYSVTEPLKLS